MPHPLHPPDTPTPCAAASAPATACPTGSALRQQVQARLQGMADPTAALLTPEAAQALLHELQVHQIELELQNEELRQSQLALEQSRAAFVDLYELAPVGYCTVNASGLVTRANLTLCTLLGVLRQQLERKPLTHFIFRDDQDHFYRLRQSMPVWPPHRQATASVDCELRLVKADGTPVWALLLATAAPDGGWQLTFTDITERKQAQALLERALAEKTALLKEVHHRVKNNLQVISSLLRLESRRSAPAQVVSIFDAMQGRIRAMAQLHDTLVRSGTLAWVDLGVYLGQIATLAFDLHRPGNGAVQLTLNMGSVPVDMDQALACGLWVHELVCNSLKHGFPQARAGAVRVELQPQAPGQPDACWRLCVRDSGVGLSPDFADRSVDTLGLQLVSQLSQQLGTTLCRASPVGGGAEFFVVFQPLAPATLVMPT